MKKRHWDSIFCIFKTATTTYEREFKLMPHHSLFEAIEQAIIEDEGELKQYRILSTNIRKVGG